MSSQSLLIRTKLHRPPVPRDFVRRPRLEADLDTYRSRPLTLVSAAAGYGKSVLVGSWLDGLDCQSAWVSLDESDNDLREFLRYFVAAVQDSFPGALEETEALLAAASLPPLSFLAGTLINELDELEEPFVLVIDDIHRINERAVNDLLAELLFKPPRGFHLVLLGRRDPFLPIAKLRVLGHVGEIRAEGLCFTAGETASFLRNVLKTEVEAEVAGAWKAGTEGWVTGLRLAALALRGRGEVPRDPFKEWKGRRHAMQYLLQEVLEQQAPSAVAHLLRSSIADRFCAPLCDALVGEEPGGNEWDGHAFIDWLVETGLFLIPLDAEHIWFRYHHLFQDLLRQEADRRCDGAAVAALHVRASEWFEAEGLVDEGLSHALAAGDVERAAQLVERNRVSALNADRWYDLEKWVSRLPDTVVVQRPELLMARAWGLVHHSRFEAVPAILNQVEILIGDDPIQEHLRGEVALLRGYMLYFLGESAVGLKHIEEALERVPVSFYEARAQSEVIFALSSQMEGRAEQSIRFLDDLLNHYDSPDDLRKTRLVVTYVFIGILSGDLAEAELANRRLRDVAERGRYAYAKAWVEYLQGLIHLLRCEFDAAVEHLRRSVSQRYNHFERAAVDSIAGLMLAYQALGRPDEAQAMLQQLREYVASLDESVFGGLVGSAASRLAILQGQPEPAVAWLESAAPPPDGAMIWWLEAPSVTRCRALLAEGSAESLEEAEERLGALTKMSEAQHNSFHLIELLALHAIGCEKQGKTDEALVVLERALMLAAPGGVVFPFLETGAPMAELLRRLLTEGYGDTEFVKRILSAYHERGRITVGAGAPKAEGGTPAAQRLTDPLTSRELEVLELLRQGLYQREIAERLFVSPETIKTHVTHIYQKLGVRGRRQAVDKGRALDLLEHR